MQPITTSFTKIRGRYLIAAWLIPAFYLPGATTLFDLFKLPPTWYWWNIFSYYYTHIIFGATIFVIGKYAAINWQKLFGDKFAMSDLWPSLKLTLLIFLFSIATAYASFIPLSWVVPDFVQWWYLDTMYLIFWEGNSYPIQPNVLNFISLVILAPVLEEIAFRGILLNRWSRKWGFIKAMLLSSAFFAITHGDPIGAFAFGMGMCVLYARTQSLWIPIICHSVNNVIAWLIDAGYNLTNGPGDLYTIDDLQSEWQIGLICAAIVILWVIMFLRGPSNLRQWHLPDA